jgi:hypothetical protein
MKKLFVSISLLSPMFALAQTSVINDVNDVTKKAVGIGNTVIYLLVSLAVIYIVWNIVQYFIKGGEDEGSRKKSGMNVLWGIIGLFIIVSIWGLVNILVGTFRTNNVTQPIPNLGNQTSTGGIPFNQVPVVQ